MIGKTQAARQPSIDDLLASIRQAIHERVAPGVPGKPAGSPPIAQGKPPSSHPDAGSNSPDEAGNGGESHRVKRTIVTTGQEGFAGLLGGDVRLEEALARLNQAGWRRDGEPPVMAAPAEVAAAVEPPVPGPKLRPTIDEWTGGASSRTRPEPIKAVPIQADSGTPEGRKPGAPGRKTDLWGQRTMQDESRTMPRPAQRSPDASSGIRTGDLLSSESASAANSAFNRLAESVRTRDPAGKPALDDMTRDCLRPLLKAWLDENLPAIVERLVREEIERVARPGR